MTERKSIRVGKATIVDWGAPDYLDGAQMQFSVRSTKDDVTLAYFAHGRHARLFAEALRNAGE